MDEISPESLTYKPPTQAVKEAFAKFPQNTTDRALMNLLQTRDTFFSKIPNFPSDKIDTALIENGIAWVLSQLVPSWRRFLDINKPVINDKYLRSNRIDPARIVRFLILEQAFPKGIDWNNKRIALVLENNQRRNLIEVIKIIPGYQSFDENQLNTLLSLLGFSKNEAGGNWISQLSQTDWNKLMLEIVYTQSLGPSKK